MIEAHLLLRPLVNTGGAQERRQRHVYTFPLSPSHPGLQKSQKDGEPSSQGGNVSGIQRQGGSIAPMGFTAFNLQT